MRRVFAALALLPALACAPKMIPDTNIKSTPDTEAIYSAISQYGKALEARDVDGIMKLVSKDFFETSGTPEAGDDYNYDGLAAKLKAWAEQVKTVRAMIQVKGIAVDVDRAKAPYFYDISYQLEVSGQLNWKRNTDVKQMQFKKDSDGVWRISGGI